MTINLMCWNSLELSALGTRTRTRESIGRLIRVQNLAAGLLTKPTGLSIVVWFLESQHKRLISWCSLNPPRIRERVEYVRKTL